MMQTGVFNITLAGVISDEAFHKCAACIAALISGESH